MIGVRDVRTVVVVVLNAVPGKGERQEVACVVFAVNKNEFIRCLWEAGF